MRKALLLILLLLSSFTALSRDFKIISRQTIDSLLRILPVAETSEQFFILNTLASYYAPLNFDSSIRYASQAIRLATTRTKAFDVALVKINIGNAYYYKMDFKNALISFLSAQTILEKGSFNKELGDLNMMMGHINFAILRADKATGYYRKALGYYQSAGNDRSFYDVYDAMSMTMFFLKYGPADSALFYGFKMLDHSRKYHDRYKETYSLAQIAGFYTTSKISPAEKHKALTYCDSAMALASEIQHDGLITIINVCLGNYYDWFTPFYKETGDLSLAGHYYEKALKASQSFNCGYLQAAVLIDLAMLDLNASRYADTKDHLDLCEARLEDFFSRDWKNTSAQGALVNAVGKIMDYFMAMRSKYHMNQFRFKLAVAKGEYQEAIDYLQLTYQTRDSMYASQQGKQIDLMVAEDEAQRLDQKIINLAKDNEFHQLKLSRSRLIFISSGAGIVLFSLILLLIFQRRKLKAEQQSVSMEQRLLRAQMNPHFIFNSLASIQNFVINENSDQASIYLSRFSQLVRNILDNSTEEYVPLEKEVSTIENYLELQKVRYAGKFDYKITVDEKIDTENVLIPPMLAQPFIENAIEHGIRHKERSGHIEVNFRLNDGFIRVEVEDDGVGREKALEIESKQKIRHRSMAIFITRDRLDILNKKLKKKIRMEIIDLKDDYGESIGTRVEFGIPVVGR